MHSNCRRALNPQFVNLFCVFLFSTFSFFSQEAKDHCVSSPCIEGQCLNTPGGYYCHCPPGRAGRHCEFPRVPCEKGGPCANGKCTFVSIFFLVCFSPFLQDKAACDAQMWVKSCVVTVPRAVVPRGGWGSAYRRRVSKLNHDRKLARSARPHFFSHLGVPQFGHGGATVNISIFVTSNLLRHIRHRDDSRHGSRWEHPSRAALPPASPSAREMKVSDFCVFGADQE